MDIASLADLVAPSAGFDPTAIDEMENRLGIRLPEDFRSFLALAGGGGEVRLDPREGLGFESDWDAYWPHVFCSVANEDYHGIRQLRRHLEETTGAPPDAPAGIVTIADDMGGNFLVLDLRPEYFGRIAVIDHEQVGDDTSLDDGWSTLADSFTEFVEQCRVVRERYELRLGRAEPAEIETADELAALLSEAARRREPARLSHFPNDGWVEYQPLGAGGRFFRKYSGTNEIRQAYYPGRKRSGIGRLVDAILAKRASRYLITPDDALAMFEAFIAHRSSDVAVRFEPNP